MNCIQAKTVLLHGSYYELITDKEMSDIHLFSGHCNQFNDGKFLSPQNADFRQKMVQIPFFPLKNDKSYAVLSSKK